MKHLRKQFPVTLLSFGYILTLFLYGCSGSNKAVSLRYNLEVGQIFKQRIVTEQTVKQEFQGEEQVVVNTVSMVTTYKVVSNDGNNTVLNVSYDTLDVKVKLPTRVMEFSSRGQFWKQQELFSQVLNTMAGKSFDITVENSSGQIKAVSGLEKLFENVLSQFQNANSEQFTSVMEMLNKSYGESAFVESFRATSSYLSGEKMKKGASWKVTTDLTNLNSQMEVNWELKEVKSSEAILTGNGVLQMMEGGKEVDVEGVTTKMEMTGTQLSNFTIDPETAWPISGRVKQDLKGVMKLREIASGETATLPLEMVNVITYSTIK